MVKRNLLWHHCAALIFQRRDSVNHKFLMMVCLSAGLSALTSKQVAAAETDGACHKSGSQVQVTGSSSDDRKADCERQGGSWSNASNDSSSSAGQSAGGGGGW
jgi:hypothetical protein